jgi:S-adenosylmethionine-diacylglycerol 3-amino-3-carboxypropyl transferase
MTGVWAEAGTDRKAHIRKALYRHRPLSKDGVSERLFASLFSGLVYPQIWEDPDVDIAAMGQLDGLHVVTIASGGCNVLAYLSRAPARIDAVDLNRSHVALNRLKVAAAKHLPAYPDFLRFFGTPGNRDNSAAYDRFLAPHLDAGTRAYWERRTWRGRRRIAMFDRDFYRRGLLGFFIATGHRVARLYGVDPREIMQSRTLADQRTFFQDRLVPVFDRRLVRWATSRKASLFCLGIPPAQYDSLIGAGDGTMADVLRSRLQKLACDFPLNDNYFAWQAFARRYPGNGEAALPPYLDPRLFPAIRSNADRAAIHNVDLTAFLACKAAGSVDRYVLLDAQDWMTDAQLDALWTEIGRTAASGARVIFRTAAEPSLLPGRLAPALLDRWSYDETLSRELSARDRSAIYGGFHIYTLKQQ